MKLLLALLSVLIVLGNVSAFAQATLNPHFKHISKDEGLPSNKILCIKQDRLGFIWFGTEDGLTRFDGTNYLVFRKDLSDKNSLINNYVNCIYEDPFSGNLWIGTATGLCYFDIKNYKFYSDSDLNSALENTSVYSIYIDQQQNRWIATFKGLYFYKKDSRTPVLCLTKPESRVKKSANFVFEDSKKRLWVGTTGGLYFLNRKSSKFSYYKLPGSETKVTSILEDSSRNLWISTATSGVFSIQKDQSIKHFCVENGFLKKSNKVHAMVEDEAGNFYIAVRDGEGLHHLNPRNNTVKVFSPDKYNSASINSTAITSIYKDKFKNIWIGTWASGINLIDKNKKPFIHYKANFRSDGLLNNYVRSAFQDSDGDIWIGTKEEGCLSQFNPAKGTFIHHQKWLYDAQKKDFSFVLSIAEAKPGFLLVGTFDNGLNLYNKRNGQFARYQHNPSNEKSIANNKVTAILKDRNNTIWVGTSKTLQKLDLNTGKFYTVRDSCHPKCILDYSEEELFFGGSVGLFSYNRKTKTVVRFHKKSKLNGGEVPDITGMVKDAKGDLWLSTIGKGIVHFNKKTREFRSYNLRNGLPSNIACDIEIDNKGHLWISTTNGLSRFDPRLKEFRNYYASEGLQSNEFEKHVSLKTRDGHLLFGGINGFNYFFPDSIQDNKIIPKVILTDFKIFNKPLKVGIEDSPLKQSISYTKELVLNHKQSVFTFEFSALNFSSSRYNQYAYRLEPLEKEWNYSGVRNIASYSSLPAGTYTFMVKASNNDGVWNKTPTILRLKVLPAPWKTWWAYLFYATVLSGFILIWLNYKNQLHIAKAEQDKLQELNSIKSQFFMNISHEFKTPLTMILSPLGKLLKMAGSDEEKKHLGYINRNALRLQNLINQLMELKSIENNSVTPQYTKGNFVQFLKELVTVFESVAEEHQIKIIFKCEKQLLTYFDEDKVEKIFYNILSNAVKFTPKNGLIVIAIDLISNEAAKSSFDSSYIQVKISNTGSKIAPDHIPHIFTNYYHIDRANSLSQPGTGIGLAFTKELVDNLGGTIEVESSDECTRFTVNLPDIKLSATDIETQLGLESRDFSYSKHLMEVITFDKFSTTHKAINLKAPSVLLVEDNKELRELLFNTLAKTYKISVANDGLEGLELAKKTHPAIIISDIIMPKLGGIELCREIKSNIEFSHIPVILLTASNTDAQKMRGMENGADVYIEKPFDLDFLKLQIRNILQTRKAQREAFAKKLSAEPEKTTVNNSADEQWVMKAMGIVEKNLDNFKFDVDAFVKEMGMSRTSLYQKIKALTDLSTNEFIINIRLKKAADLLQNSDLSVSEIAYKVGFNSPNYFGICFKKNYKMTPSKFVEKHKERSDQQRSDQQDRDEHKYKAQANQNL